MNCFSESVNAYSFQPSESIQKVWQVELDLLNVLKKLCIEHNLNYFAIGGTLLGAVRHKGFIPWDDDIDVVMPWSDCQKLISVASEEISYPYFCKRTYLKKMVK